MTAPNGRDNVIMIGGSVMKKHGCKILLLILAAMLCLFSTGGAISVRKFSQAEASDGPTGSAGADRYAEGPVTAANTGYEESIASSSDAGSNKTVRLDDNMSSSKNAGSKENAEPVLSCKYYSEREFFKSVNGAVIPSSGTGNEGGDTMNVAIKGGIVPHHLLAGRMIASFFQNLAKDPPGTIILLGPNHKLAGKSEIHTSSADWITAFGTLEADGEIAKVLADRMGASENNRLMEDEHSISSLVPYIKYYLPEAKIVPVLLYGNYTPGQSKKLGTLLAEIAAERPDTAILASIDFSHYLDVVTADRMDEATLDAICSWDLDRLGMMNNDNLDSVPSAITLLTAMDALGARDIAVTGHNNSSRITGSGHDFTTSYYTMFFRAPD